MIILITDVTDAEVPYQSIDIVTFKVVDGTPSIEEVTQLLNRELDNLMSLLYSPKTKQGQLMTAGRICVKGEHFNAVEHAQLHH
ncbi:hypothetical protein JL857_20625 [Vibrio parahaemolyticus]|uniref:Uncharacterized protein n=1 Tax=Vibrio parahaemolyticus TaxID=670 RepID=A0A9Q3YLE6_VIBPH|nr:hypothetical protein [Vibrio parahaemolyticus]MCC3807522.1 hypothetical protein [Vibrio parahaemolyticus]MCI9696490.1 hypothetical protein [Vibrio parahaemolyticus]MCI9711046.1 hypothetical protein [Vibrio parahaemolyticus]MCI9715926.1 hypothetical protein [Vibrio parahaemolyticus]